MELKTHLLTQIVRFGEAEKEKQQFIFVFEITVSQKLLQAVFYNKKIDKNIVLSLMKLLVKIIVSIMRHFLSLYEKPYFPSPGISVKAQKDQVNIIFPSTFWLKKRPYFQSPKSSKQEFFSNQ